ncbi:MAG: hypothetical protein WB438_09270 [Candidatus Cybelea sp.]
MNKTGRGEAAGDASTETLRADERLPFTILNLQPVRYGAKVLEFEIATEIGVIQLDLFEPPGREPFIQTRSIRSKYDGEWKRTMSLDREFAKRVLSALRAQALSAKEKRAQRAPQGVEPSETLLESERRFNSVFAALDGGDDTT